MAALTFDQRLVRAEEVLTRVADGDFDVRIDLQGTPDALGGLEMGINLLIVDLRSIDKANRAKAQELATQQRELQEKLATIEQQEASIRKLTTPVIEVWDDILALPIVGMVDQQRSEELMSHLLNRVIATRSRCVIVDVTGMDLLDTHTADYLLRIVRTVSLVGAYCVLSGIRPKIAQTLVYMGADLREVRAVATLKEGIKDCIAHLAASTASPEAASQSHALAP